MTTDDLSRPLGQGKLRPQRAMPVTVQHAIAVALSLSVLGFAGWVMLVDDPLGGEPLAVVPAALHADNADLNPGTPTPQPGAMGNPEGGTRRDGSVDNEKPPPGMRTVNIIDGTSGKRQAVVVPETRDDREAPPEAKSPMLEERLSEPG